MLRSVGSHALRSISIVALSAGGAGILLAAACTGGGGEPGEGVGAYEPVRSSFERAPNSNEAPPSQASQASGQGSSVGTSSSGSSAGTSGALSANCAGTYNCNQAGQTSTATLVATNNGCIVEGVNYDVQSDGKVTSNGQQIGTWVAGGNGNVITVSLNNGAGTLVCTRTGSAGSTSGGNGGGAPTPSGTATGAPAPVFDAGGK